MLHSIPDAVVKTHVKHSRCQTEVASSRYKKSKFI